MIDLQRDNVLQAIAKDFDPKHFRTEGGNLSVCPFCHVDDGMLLVCPDLGDDLLDLMDSVY